MLHFPKKVSGVWHTYLGDKLKKWRPKFKHESSSAAPFIIFLINFLVLPAFLFALPGRISELPPAPALEPILLYDFLADIQGESFPQLLCAPVY